MKNIIRISMKKAKYIFFLIFGIIVGCLTCRATTSYLVKSDKISYTAPSNNSATNVEEALSELQNKVQTKTKCPDGMFCEYVYGPEATGATINTTNIPSDTLGLKGIAYLNPTDLTASCTSSSITTSGTYTGCMKWYIFDIQTIGTTTYYTMILDHNVISGIKYNSADNNGYSKEIIAQLNNLVNSRNWKVNPRLITAEEIVEITNKKATRWNAETGGAIYFGSSNYYWLYDYTINCVSSGCKVASTTVGDYGYWTSSARSNSTNLIWYVIYDGAIYSSSTNNSDYGLRPVITISK